MELSVLRYQFDDKASDMLYECFRLIHQYYPESVAKYQLFMDRVRKRVGSVNDDDYNRPWLSRIVARPEFTKLFSWAVPSEAAINRITGFISDCNMMLSVGSGLALWEALIQAKSDNRVIATDLYDPYWKYTADNAWMPCEQLRDTEAVLKYADADCLFVCWPSGGHAGLELFRGPKLIYIGEHEDGCTGSYEFHRILAEDWQLVEEVKIAKWYGLNDRMYLYVRR